MIPGDDFTTKLIDYFGRLLSESQYGDKNGWPIYHHRRVFVQPAELTRDDCHFLLTAAAGAARGEAASAAIFRPANILTRSPAGGPPNIRKLY